MKEENVLKLHKVLFDEIVFQREGDRENDEAPEISFQVSIGQNENGVYRVTLSLEAYKAQEYRVQIQLSGFFEMNPDCTEDIKTKLLEENAVSILFPYLRSELTLITAQPNTTTVTLPVMNIAAMMKNAKKTDHTDE